MFQILANMQVANRTFFLVAVVFLQLIQTTQLVADKPQRPNIVLIMADDLGYADIGCCGSEIETPYIDGLAKEGLQFSHFRATTMCVTSRIALMAGMPMHRAGQHNYAHSIPLAQLLKSAGYRTLMTGKWHGGSPDPRSPELFDRSFGFLGGATDSFVGGNDWFLNDQPFNNFGPNFYASHAFADRSIEFMKEAVAEEQPFFMYVAFNAPHHPCQAPRATVEKYSKTYMRGYQAIRKERRELQLSLGLIKPEWEEAEHGSEVRQWDELTDHRQEVEAGRMAAYAAAVDEVDQSVGRILNYLRDEKLEENTLVIFISDNGGDYSNGSITTDEQQVPWQAKTNPSSSNGWAMVKCTPFRFYKHSSHEGGIATPMVIRWPAGIKRECGTLIDAPTSITDIYPTLIELANITYPSTWDGREKRSLTGQSLLPLFDRNGERVNKPVFQWYAISRAMIDDEWKAVSLYEGPWQLFDLRTDRGETKDLAKEQPERLHALVSAWEEFAQESGVPNPHHTPTIYQRGWGWHRLKMACPVLHSVSPANGGVSKSTKVDLTIRVDQPIDFTNTTGKKISLYEVGNETQAVWEADPDQTHLAQGKNSITFTDIPELSPVRHYAVRCDAGWVKVGGRPFGPLNDGAYWWRFRTPQQSK